MEILKLDLLFCLVVAFSTSQYALVWLATEGGLYHLNNFVYSLERRPFVYRMLLPFLSRSFSWLTGIDADHIAIALLPLFGAGFYVAMKYLLRTFYPNNAQVSIGTFVACEFFFLLILGDAHMYDVATGFFSTLALALIMRGKHLLFLLTFPFMTLNRETSFLFSLFWLAAAFHRAMPRRLFYGAVYQGLVWFLIRVGTMYMYADNPGTPLLWRPEDNLSAYILAPGKTLVLISIFLGIALLVFKRWKEKPGVMRTAFLIIFPLQVLLHITMGMPWEVRVYAESYPLVAVLILGTFQSSAMSPLIRR